MISIKYLYYKLNTLVWHTLCIYIYIYFLYVFIEYIYIYVYIYLGWGIQVVCCRPKGMLELLSHSFMILPHELVALRKGCLDQKEKLAFWRNGITVLNSSCWIYHQIWNITLIILHRGLTLLRTHHAAYVFESVWMFEVSNCTRDSFYWSDQVSW